MTYTELKESLEKTDNKVYLYCIKDTGNIPEVALHPEDVISIDVNAKTNEVEMLVFNKSNVEKITRYLNTRFALFYCDEPNLCSGWALTEQEAEDIVAQIKADLKVKQLAKLREQFDREGITKEDLLSIVEDMR